MARQFTITVTATANGKSATGKTKLDVTPQGASEPFALAGIKNASILYKDFGDDDVELLFTFDENGRKFRIDSVFERNSQGAMIVDHNKREFWMVQTWLAPVWVQGPYETEFGPIGTPYIVKEDALDDYRTNRTKLVLGFECKIYSHTEDEVQYEIAVHEGLVLSESENGVEVLRAIGIKKDVPNAPAFDRTMYITWWP